MMFRRYNSLSREAKQTVLEPSICISGICAKYDAREEVHRKILLHTVLFQLLADRAGYGLKKHGRRPSFRTVEE
jgi:hypothetical protein